MKTYNKEFFELFNEIADLMSLLDENPFKIRAYREAAMRIRQDFRPITKKDTDKKKLMEIPRVGEAIAEKMIQYIKEGKINYLEKLRKRVPKPVREMLKIPNLGPNRVRDLYINLGIKSKKELIKLAKEGKISELPGFGPKLVGNILEALEIGQQKKKRHYRADLIQTAEKIKIEILKVSGVSKAEIAGSYRRKSKTVGDLDILVCGDKIKVDSVEKKMSELFKDIKTLGKGDTKLSFVIFPENLQVDIRFVPEESYGAALLYFTGSKDFNVMMRRAAIQKEYLLNEYGLFHNGEMIAGKTEEEVFEKLGLPYTKPEKRN